MESDRTRTPASQLYRKPAEVEKASGERRLSLYDVLTGEAPIRPLPKRETPEASSGAARAETAAAADTMSDRGVGRGIRGSGGGSGNGVIALGRGGRRASIFDRIADVVFNEEQKEQNPVDAVAVRSVRFHTFQLSWFLQLRT